MSNIQKDTIKASINPDLNLEKGKPAYHKVLQYLKQRYQFRRNTIKNIIEYAPAKLDLKGVVKWKQVNEIDLSVEINLANFLSRPFGKDRMCDIISSRFCAPPFNPLTECFNSLPSWDQKTDHIKEWTDYITLEDEGDRSRLEMVFKKWGIATIMCANKEKHPNFYNKPAIILQGSQGLGKTPFLRSLIPNSLGKAYIKQNPPKPGESKDSRIALARNLFIMMDEIDKYLKNYQLELEAYMTMDSINDRLPYGRVEIKLDRVASFLGTCNSDNWLRDETGSSRFIIFSLGSNKINESAKKFNSDLFWAQCFYLYKNGFNCDFTGEELKINEKANEAFTATTREYDLLIKYFMPSNKEQGKFMSATDIINGICTKEGTNNFSLKTWKMGKAMVQARFKKMKVGKDRRYGYYAEELDPNYEDGVDAITAIENSPFKLKTH